MSTHNLCFRAKNKKKKAYPCTLQFHYIKVGCKGIYKSHGHVILIVTFTATKVLSAYNYRIVETKAARQLLLPSKKSECNLF